MKHFLKTTKSLYNERLRHYVTWNENDWRWSGGECGLGRTEGISTVEGLAAVMVVVVVVEFHLQGHVNIISTHTDSDNSFIPLLGFIW